MSSRSKSIKRGKANRQVWDGGHTAVISASDPGRSNEPDNDVILAIVLTTFGIDAAKEVLAPSTGPSRTMNVASTSNGMLNGREPTLPPLDEVHREWRLPPTGAIVRKHVSYVLTSGLWVLL